MKASMNKMTVLTPLLHFLKEEVIPIFENFWERILLSFTITITSLLLLKITSEENTQVFFSLSVLIRWLEHHFFFFK